MEYVLKRMQRSRSIKVRVEPGGRVLVTAPYLVPKFMIERFVKQNETWIERQLKRASFRSDLYPTLDWEKKVVSYLGKLHSIRIANRESRIGIRNQEIIVSPITGLESDAHKMLIKWLKKEGEKYINNRLPNFSKLMKLKYGTVIFRQQKSRWGSCSGEGNLSFNWRLIHFKPEIIDYVLIHELAHIRHHDHSANFWQLVGQFDPTYKTKRQFLHKQILMLI
jgi:predicted metal-dependent hydrolase